MKIQNYRISWKCRDMCIGGTFGWIFKTWKFGKTRYIRLFGRYIEFL